MRSNLVLLRPNKSYWQITRLVLKYCQLGPWHQAANKSCFAQTNESYGQIARLLLKYCHLGPNQGSIPDSKVHGASMGPTWILSAPDGPHVGPMNLAIRDVCQNLQHWLQPIRGWIFAHNCKPHFPIDMSLWHWENNRLVIHGSWLLPTN